MFILKLSHGLLKFSMMKSLRATLALHRHFLSILPSSLVSDHAFAKDGVLVPLAFICEIFLHVHHNSQ